MNQMPSSNNPTMTDPLVHGSASDVKNHIANAEGEVSSCILKLLFVFSRSASRVER